MRVRILAAVACACLIGAIVPARAPASVLAPVCSVLGHVPIPEATSCRAANRGLDAGGQLLHGNAGGATATVVGATASEMASVVLGGLSAAAAGAAKFALTETATLIDATTSPSLQAPWFQRVYWRMAAIGVLLTLPCLFAAAVQSLIRSDLTLLLRAAFGYLPAAMLGVGICAQLVSLLLAATDVLCGFISGVAGHAAHAFLSRAGDAIVALSIARGSPFLAFVVALFTIAGAVVLWLELMMREAAVYVVVALLPLAFAAFVWPARRVWALRAIELLAALILAKLAMVTVLTLGGAALTQSPNVAGFLVGLVLLVLGAFAPWAMLRIIPMTELAAGLAGRLRSETPLLQGPEQLASSAAHAASSHLARGARAAAEMVIARMSNDGHRAQIAGGSDVAPEPDVTPDAPGPEPGPPVPGPADNGATTGESEPDSMFAAPDGAWRPLGLSLDARWRPGDAPLHQPPQRPGDDTTAPADAADEAAQPEASPVAGVDPPLLDAEPPVRDVEPPPAEAESLLPEADPPPPGAVPPPPESDPPPPGTGSVRSAPDPDAPA